MFKGEYKHFIKQVFSYFIFCIEDIYIYILLNINILHLAVGTRGSPVRSTFGVRSPGSLVRLFTTNCFFFQKMR